MNLAQLAKVLLVKACEEQDSEQRFILRFVREQASQHARELLSSGGRQSASSEGEAFVIQRAEKLFQGLVQQFPTLESAFTVLDFRLPLALLIGSCLIGGVLADPIGPARQINLLNFSLLTLLIWNAVVYARLGIRWMGSGKQRRVSQGGLMDWFASLSLKWPLRHLHGQEINSQEEKLWLAKSLAAYSRSLSTNGRTVFETYIQAIFHAAAAALALGVIIGLYLRGFSFLYKAGWDSTFLDAEGVYTFLSVLFAPASVILHTPVPGVQAIAAMQGTPTANAAIWIHFWAITTIVCIVLPRTLLAIVGWSRMDVLTSDLHLPLSDRYYAHLVNPFQGNGQIVELIPYSYHVHERSDALVNLCGQIFGAQAHIQIRDPIAYGELPVDFQVEGECGYCAVILFSLAQPPEETHGEFLEDMKVRIQGLKGEGTLLILIDGHPYSTIENNKREDERLQAWKRLVKTSGLVAFELRPQSEQSDEWITQMCQGFWPSRPKDLH